MNSRFKARGLANYRAESVVVKILVKDGHCRLRIDELRGHATFAEVFAFHNALLVMVSVWPPPAD
jgi:hypothetical protein